MFLNCLASNMGIMSPPFTTKLIDHTPHSMSDPWSYHVQAALDLIIQGRPSRLVPSLHTNRRSIFRFNLHFHHNVQARGLVDDTGARPGQ